MYPQDLLYSPAHTWIRVDGRTARVGITHYAQKQLRDLVFANIYTDLETITAGESFGTLESVKSISDVIALVTARIVAVNQLIIDQPEVINKDPYGQGYLLEVEIDEAGQLATLLDAAQYRALVQPTEG